MEYTIERTYTHKTFGKVGAAKLEADIVAVKLDGKVLPADSVTYLLTFALQSLQDAYAGAADATEARANFDKKLGKVMEGTIGVRGEGGGMTDEEITRAKVVISGAKMTFDKGVKTVDRYRAALARYAEMPEKTKVAVDKHVARLMETITLDLDV